MPSVGAARVNRSLLVNLALMFAAGLLFTLFTSEIVELKRGHHGSPVLFAFSRTGFFTLVTFTVVTAPLLLLRRGRKKFTTVPLVLLWLGFIVLNLAAYVGERLP